MATSIFSPSPETALFNALRMETTTVTKYYIMEAADLGESGEKWVHLSTSGSWDDKDVAVEVLRKMREHRADSNFRLVCHVESIQIAQALVIEE